MLPSRLSPLIRQLAITEMGYYHSSRNLNADELIGFSKPAKIGIACLSPTIFTAHTPSSLGSIHSRRFFHHSSIRLFSHSQAERFPEVGPQVVPGIPPTTLQMLIEFIKNHKALTFVVSSTIGLIGYTIANANRTDNVIKLLRETKEVFKEERVVELEVKIKELEKNRTDLETELSIFKTSNKELEIKLTKFEKLKHTAYLIEELSNFQRLINGIDFKEALDRLYDFKRQEIEQTEVRIKALEEKELEIKNQLEQKNNALNKFQQDLKDLGDNRSRIEQEKSAADQKIKELERDLSSRQSALQATSTQNLDEIKKLKDEIKSLEGTQNTRDADIKKMSKDLVEKERLISGLKKSINDVENDKNNIGNQHKSLQEKLDNITRSYEFKDKSIQSIEKSLNVFRDNLSKLTVTDLKALHRIWNPARIIGSERLTLSISGALCLSALLSIMSNIQEYKHNLHTIDFSYLDLNRNHNLIDYIIPVLITLDVKTINLQHNYLYLHNGPESVSKIIEGVKSLKILMLNNNSLDDQHITTIINSVNKSNLDKVVIQNNSFNVDSVVKILDKKKFQITTQNGECIIVRIPKRSQN